MLSTIAALVCVATFTQSASAKKCVAHKDCPSFLPLCDLSGICELCRECRRTEDGDITSIDGTCGGCDPKRYPVDDKPRRTKDSKDKKKPSMKPRFPTIKSRPSAGKTVFRKEPYDLEMGSIFSKKSTTTEPPLVTGIASSCDAHSDCPAIIPFCYLTEEGGECTVCEECEYYHDGIDGTCGSCGKGYPTIEDNPERDVLECESHDDCDEFCYNGRCDSCSECHYCGDGIDGTCGYCGDGYPTMEEGPCESEDSPDDNDDEEDARGYPTIKQRGYPTIKGKAKGLTREQVMRMIKKQLKMDGEEENPEELEENVDMIMAMQEGMTDDELEEEVEKANEYLAGSGMDEAAGVDMEETEDDGAEFEETLGGYACPEAGTTAVNHAGEFPGQISCGCETVGMEPDIVAEPLCRLCVEGDTEFFYYRVEGICGCVERDSFASSYGCLANGECYPDPTCAPEGNVVFGDFDGDGDSEILSASCEAHSDCPEIIPFCYFTEEGGECTVCEECEYYHDGIDGTCGICGDGFPSIEGNPEREVEECESHDDCDEFCYAGQCDSCDACEYCEDGIDGTCGYCGDGFPTMEEGPCEDARLFSAKQPAMGMSDRKDDRKYQKYRQWIQDQLDAEGETETPEEMETNVKIVAELAEEDEKKKAKRDDGDIEVKVVNALRKAGKKNRQGMTEEDIGEKLIEGLAMMVEELRLGGESDLE